MSQLELTLMTYLRGLQADPADPKSPLLYVSRGVLSERAERYVTSTEYAGKPYIYLLNIDSVVAQRYDNGSARYTAPVDLVIEARAEDPATISLAEETKVRGRVNALFDTIFDGVLKVTHLEPGIRLAERFARVGGYRAQERRKGFYEALLRLENSSVLRRAPPIGGGVPAGTP